jgi:hypothetical protein
MKNQKVTSTTNASTTTAVDPKAELKAIREKAKALRAQVKAAQAQEKEASKEKSKEVTLRWISNFSQRITRLQAKIDRAAQDRQKLITRAKENGWLQ